MRNLRLTPLLRRVVPAAALLLAFLLVRPLLWYSTDDLSGLLGIPLPSSVADIQSQIYPRFIGEYDGYVRFSIAPEHLDELLADPNFGMTQDSTIPYSAFSNAVSGSTPVAELVQRSRTDWWNPQDGAPYTLSYRSFTRSEAFTGPDFAWYLVDKSDPLLYTVYVYITEV